MENIDFLFSKALEADKEHSSNLNKQTLANFVKAWEKVLLHPSYASLPKDTAISIMSRVAIGYSQQFDFSSNLDDLNRAISLHEQTVQDSSENSINLPIFLSNLGGALSKRYSIIGDKKDIEKEILLHRRAIEVTPRNSKELPMFYNNLGAALITYYELVTGSIKDLDEAIRILSESVKITPINSDQRSDRLSNLGGALISLYTLQKHLPDLENAIENLFDAVNSTQHDDHRLPQYTLNLGIALIKKYEHTGAMKLLDDAIDLFKKADELSLDSSPYKSNYINELGTGFLARYLAAGEIKDIESGIDCFDKVCTITPRNTPNFARYSYNLANALNYYSTHHRKKNYIKKAIDFAKQAIENTSANSPELGRYYNCLGNALSKYKEISYIDEAITVYKKAIEITSNSTDLDDIYNSLGVTYQERYDITFDDSDIDEAIKHIRQALKLTPRTSTTFPRHLNSLGVALTRRKDIRSLNEGFEAFESAAKVGMELDVSQAFIAARNWINCSLERGAWSEIIKAYKYADATIERLIKIQILRDDKEIILSESQGLSSIIAFALAKENRLPEAVVALEKGLARLLSESLLLDRANLTALEKSEHSVLIDSYKKTLEKINFLKQQKESETIFADLKDTTNELDKHIESIRQIPGYSHFLSSLNISDIYAVANDTNTTIIYLLAEQTEGLALIIRDGIKPVWLKDFTNSKLHEKLGYEKEIGYLSAYRNWMNNKGSHEDWLVELKKITKWLWHSVLQKLIKSLNLSEKFVIIPVGKVALLPLHAAWTEDDTVTRNKVYAIDSMQISYAPNANSLINAKVISDQISVFNLLGIDEPLPVEAPSLSYSKYETMGVARNFLQPHILKNDKATLSEVVKQLKSFSVVHFSCHGYANLFEPITSGLLLANNGLLTIKHLLDLKLDGIRIVTLSACETAIPGIELPDEIVNLPSALMQSGTAGIISSLWPVSQVSTMLIMIRFYDNWEMHKDDLAKQLRDTQIWVKDSTSKEKIDYFCKIAEDIGLSKETKDELCRSIGLIDFSNEFHWAAFTFTGV